VEIQPVCSRATELYAAAELNHNASIGCFLRLLIWRASGCVHFAYRT
jgi:hypothetical protein